jgi:hypothetical protein
MTHTRPAFLFFAILLGLALQFGPARDIVERSQGFTYTAFCDSTALSGLTRISQDDGSTAATRKVPMVHPATMYVQTAKNGDLLVIARFSASPVCGERI